MRRFTYFGLCLVLFSCVVANAWSETMYIRTIVKITLRTGPGTDHKIIAMVRSGQEVEVLDAGEDWSRIQVTGGQIGWVMTNLLTAEKPQRFISRDQESVGKTDNQRQLDLLNKNKRLIAENQRLTLKLSESQSALKTMEETFESYKNGAEGYETLKSEHRKATTLLREQTEKTENLEGVISDFRLQHNIWWFVAGAGVLFVGFTIGLSVRRQRRRSILM